LFLSEVAYLVSVFIHFAIIFASASAALIDYPAEAVDKNHAVLSLTMHRRIYIGICRCFRLRLDLGLFGFVSRLFVGVGEHFLVLDFRRFGRLVLRSAFRFFGFGEVLLNLDTAVIDDGEISRLKELSVEVEPAIAVVNLRARESIALNLTAFEERLYLSYPEKRGGEPQNPSEALSYCKSAFASMPTDGVFPYNCCERVPAELALLALKDDFEAGREEDGAKYASLRAALGNKGASCGEEPRETRVEKAG